MRYVVVRSCNQMPIECFYHDKNRTMHTNVSNILFEGAFQTIGNSDSTSRYLCHSVDVGISNMKFDLMDEVFKHEYIDPTSIHTIF